MVFARVATLTQTQSFRHSTQSLYTLLTCSLAVAYTFSSVYFTLHCIHIYRESAQVLHPRQYVQWTYATKTKKPTFVVRLRRAPRLRERTKFHYCVLPQWKSVFASDSDSHCCMCVSVCSGQRWFKRNHVMPLQTYYSLHDIIYISRQHCLSLILSLSSWCLAFGFCFNF